MVRKKHAYLSSRRGKKSSMRICIGVSLRPTRGSKTGNGASAAVADPVDVGDPLYPVAATPDPLRGPEASVSSHRSPHSDRRPEGELW